MSCASAASTSAEPTKTDRHTQTTTGSQPPRGGPVEKGMTMKKHILRAAIAAPFIAATLGAPAAAFAAPADEAPADDSATITIPGAGEVDLSDIGDSTYEVTADWGKGEVIADATEGGNGTGDGSGEAIEPETKDEADETDEVEKPDPKTDDETADEPAPKSESTDESDEKAKTTAEDGSDSPAEDAEDATEN